MFNKTTTEPRKQCTNSRRESNGSVHDSTSSFLRQLDREEADIQEACLKRGVTYISPPQDGSENKEERQQRRNKLRELRRQNAKRGMTTTPNPGTGGRRCRRPASRKNNSPRRRTATCHTSLMSVSSEMQGAKLATASARKNNNTTMEQREIVSQQPVVVSHTNRQTNNGDKTASPLPNSNNNIPDIILQERFKHGMCPSCGSQIYKMVQDEESSSCRMEALTIPGAVVLGRCLYCYPDNLKDDNQHQEEHHNWTISSMNGSEQTADESFSSSATTEHYDTNGDNNCEIPCAESSSNRTVRLQDSEGTTYVGMITYGTAKKGRGVFSFIHKEGLYEGRSEIYEGEFENGYFEGRGVYIGAGWRFVYEGDFRRSDFHGYGKMIRNNGEMIYEGQWENDEMNGVGTCQWVDGNRYSGEWKDGVQHGFGTFYFANGDVYDGGWENGKQDGMGLFRCAANGSTQEGRWENGEFKGQSIPQ